MKVLIAYASKTGTTKECAIDLSTKIPQVTVIDLNNEEVKPEEFDVVVIGTSIRMGMIQKVAKQFIQENWDVLKTKHIGCFFCNGFIEQESEIIAHNFTKEFVEHAFYLRSFGGVLDKDRLKGLDKIITNIVTASMKGKSPNSIVVLEDRIQELANAILGL